MASRRGHHTGQVTPVRGNSRRRGDASVCARNRETEATRECRDLLESVDDDLIERRAAGVELALDAAD
jgi:hypothetical protein